MTDIERACRFQWILATARHDAASSPRDGGSATRMANARAAHRGNDPRAGIRAYCRGNVWLTENAKAVGNW